MVNEVFVVIDEYLEDAGRTAGVGVGPAVESIERVRPPATVRTLLLGVNSRLDN